MIASADDPDSQTRSVLADPEGNEFCILRQRSGPTSSRA